MGDKAAAVGVLDDMAEGMQCMDHPYRSNPGGVCAFCLQEKLGKLVSSSKSTPFFSLHPPPLSSSSSSPTSFISDAGAALGLPSGRSGPGAGRRYGFPFLAATHIKKKKNGGVVAGGYGSAGRKVMATPSAVANESSIVMKRSKSVVPRTAACGGGGGGVGDFGVQESPRKKSFWSFLYLPAGSSTGVSSSAAINSSSSINRRRSTSSSTVTTGNRDVAYNEQQQHPAVDDEAGGASGQAEAESPSGCQASSSLGRKVGRSRSVGCGSRSFSGDFLERISTGFGDCTLRRVESHREPKSKIVLHLDAGDQPPPTMKERVKCRGLFGGFGTPSSTYAPDEGFDGGGRSRMSSSGSAHGGRSRTWGWAFASPMRAFRPHSSSALATNDIISSINAGNKMASGGGGRGKVSKVDSNPSILTVES